MRELTAEEQERAARLHEEAIIIDTLQGGPQVAHPDSMKRLEELEAAGADILTMVLEIMDPRVSINEKALLEGSHPGFWEAYDRSGVTVGSYTLGAFGTKGTFSPEQAIHDIAAWTRRFDTLERMHKITCAEDIRRTKAAGDHGTILNFQNATSIGNDVDMVDFFYDLGLRIIQLTYNWRNLLGDGCTERNQDGLSNFGVAVVERMNEIGMVVDVSHSGEPTTLDAVRVSQRPVAVTHSVCKGVYEHVRGKSDQVLEELAANGGYFGVCLVPFFLTADPEPSLDHFIEHIDHAVRVMGAEHVGISSDWDKLPAPIAKQFGALATRELGFSAEHGVSGTAYVRGLERYAEFPNVTAALVAAGYSDDEVKGIMGGNFLRVFEEVCG
jgi:membrane dipeptidase